MRMTEKCTNKNNSNHPLTSRRTDGGKTMNMVEKETRDQEKTSF